MLHADGDLPLQAPQLRLPPREILGLAFARELREIRTGAGHAQLQLGQVATPQFAFAAGVAERRIARVVGAPQRLVGAMRFRLRARQFTVEMAYRGVDHRDVRAQQVGGVAPFVDQQDRIGRRIGNTGPGAISGFGVGARLAHSRELRLAVRAPVVQVQERGERVTLRDRLGFGDAFGGRRRGRSGSARASASQLVDAGFRFVGRRVASPVRLDRNAARSRCGPNGGSPGIWAERGQGGAEQQRRRRAR